MKLQKERNETSESGDGVIRNILVDWWNTKPYFVNEKGLKFWLDYGLTQYAIRQGLKHVHIWYVLEADGTKTRLITQNNLPVYENQGLESVACHLDMMAIAQKEDP